MIVLVCKMDLRFLYNQSLKNKRRVLSHLKGLIKNRFGLPLAEVGDNDLWQRSKLGFSLVGSDKRSMRDLMDKVVRTIEDTEDLEVLDIRSESFVF